MMISCSPIPVRCSSPCVKVITELVRWEEEDLPYGDGMRRIHKDVQFLPSGLLFRLPLPDIGAVIRVFDGDPFALSPCIENPIG